MKFYQDSDNLTWHLDDGVQDILLVQGEIGMSESNGYFTVYYINKTGKSLAWALPTQFQKEDGTFYTSRSDFFGAVKGFFLVAGTNSPTTGTLLVSAGTAVKPSITYALGNVTIGAGTYWLYKNSNFTGGIVECNIKTDTTFTTAETGTTYYAYADYNNGIPAIKFTSDVSVINYSNNCVLYTFVCNVDFTCSIIDWDEPALGLPDKLLKRLVECRRFERANGLELSSDSSQHIHINEGVIWQGSFKNVIPSFASETSPNILFQRIHNTTTDIWRRDAVTTYPNTQYDNGDGTLATLTDGSYGVIWVYKSMSDNLKNAHIVLGTKSYTLEEAKQSQPGQVPPALNTNDVLVGRIIIKKGDTTATQIDSAFAATFAGSASYQIVVGSPVYFHVDNTRTDSFVPDGSLAKPFAKIGDAFAKITDLTKSYCIDVAPSLYNEPVAYNVPAAPFILHGNGSTFTFTSVTINNLYNIDNLYSIGNVTYAFTGATRSMRQGGSIDGDVVVAGFEDFKSVNFTGGHTTSVSANSNPLFSHCTVGQKFKSLDPTSVLTINDCSFNRPSVDDYNIDMALGGVLVLKGGLMVNKGTTKVNINLAGASTSSSAPSMLSGVICSSGIISGTAYAILSSDNIIPYLSGTAIHYAMGATSNTSMFGVTTSTANAYVITVPGLITGYTAGMEVTFIPNFTNTGDSTFNINGLGAGSVKRGSFITDSSLQVSDIEKGVLCVAKYDGTYWRVMNPRTQSTTNKNNLTASAAPAVTDDINKGYSAGSMWIYNGTTYTCSSSVAGAAVWVSSADTYYFDTWASLVAAISVTGTTYVGKYCDVTNANGGPSSNATYVSSSGSVTNPIVDGGEAIYKITQQGTTYTVVCNNRTVTNPIITSVMLSATNKPTAAGYYIFTVTPSNGIPAGTALNDIVYYNGTTWALWQKYASATTVLVAGASLNTQVTWRKFQGTWMSTADEYVPDGNEYQTGKLYNNKPVYRKCATGTMTTTSTQNANAGFSVPVTGTILSIAGVCLRTDNKTITITGIGEAEILVDNTNGNVVTWTSSSLYLGRPFTAWVEYTKS